MNNKTRDIFSDIGSIVDFMLARERCDLVKVPIMTPEQINAAA